MIIRCLLAQTDLYIFRIKAYYEGSSKSMKISYLFLTHLVFSVILSFTYANIFARTHLVKLTERTLQSLSQEKDWYVAAITVDSALIRNPGTRSQALEATVRVLASSSKEISSTLRFNHYVSDQALLESGKKYIIILINEDSDSKENSWRVIQSQIYDGENHEIVISNTTSLIKDSILRHKTNATKN
jgi:hypothetical protein